LPVPRIVLTSSDVATGALMKPQKEVDDYWTSPLVTPSRQPLSVCL
jgi:hypothetical protein